VVESGCTSCAGTVVTGEVIMVEPAHSEAAPESSSDAPVEAAPPAPAEEAPAPAADAQTDA
jgi:hypothetical protein